MYGIRTLALRAPRLRSIVEDCALAAKSADARDKYFETYVGGAAPGASKKLRSELPSLEASNQFESACWSSACFVFRLRALLWRQLLQNWRRPCPKFILAMGLGAS